ncbi:MAG: hypothetical protein KDC03_04300, partial [Flavobacteriales bacterium]|nr:hypothetical protein [Flavobacteriales bacterium]
QVLSVSTSAPNGGVDQNPGNDTRTQDFFSANPGQTVEVNITLDDYGTETTWEVTNNQGTVLASGGPYQDNADGTVVSATLCLANGCYDFTIYDDYGDGICCDYGNGSYQVVDAFG